jgi:hypothetical protein
MKRYKFCASLLTALAFLLAAGAWAADRTAVGEGTPAILASLDNGKVTILDDQATMAIRGQAYQYVLVRTVLNPLDFGPGLNWTNNLLGYRYGAWGGPGWTNGGGVGSNTPADAMDALFMQHDLGTLTDQGLINALKSLPNAPGGFWGLIYVPAAGDITAGSGLPVGKNVWVSGLSILGGQLFLGWRPMPFTEYSRREALTGMQLLGLRP